MFDVELRYVDLPFKLGDTEVTLPVGVGDIVAGFGNIGNGFLSQFVVTFDWSTKTLYLDPVAADGSFGTAAPTAGSIGWNGTNVVVSKVAKGSPAEQAGMKLGDVVSSVDGKACRPGTTSARSSPAPARRPSRRPTARPTTSRRTRASSRSPRFAPPAAADRARTGRSTRRTERAGSTAFGPHRRSRLAVFAR